MTIFLLCSIIKLYIKRYNFLVLGFNKLYKLSAEICQRIQLGLSSLNKQQQQQQQQNIFTCPIRIFNFSVIKFGVAKISIKRMAPFPHN